MASQKKGKFEKALGLGGLRIEDTETLDLFKKFAAPINSFLRDAKDLRACQTPTHDHPHV